MNDFIEYLKTEKHKAENTLIAYKRDLNNFEKFLSDKRSKTFLNCAESDAVAYVLELNQTSKSKSTINRNISALRTYFDYLILNGDRTDNPFLKIKTSKNEARKIEYLTISEIEQLLALPDDSTKGLRDLAIMEFMYGTGARVTETVRLQIADINFKMGFVTLRDVNDESRIVPLGKYALAALENYLSSAYSEIKGRAYNDDDYVFINFQGEPLTRQGIWKILKEYSTNLGFDKMMSPQILRDSFAVHILQNGGDLKTLQELMGFDDMTVGIAYLAVTDIHVREVFARCHPRA